jgi:putative intracellular protease/amidase
MVLSSHSTLGDTGRSTGWYLPEAAHPWKTFTEAGFGVDFVSPKGGVNPFDGFDDTDADQVAFLKAFGGVGPTTMTPWEVDPSRYRAVFYVGGHGTMWDFAENEQIAKIARQIYEASGAVAAVCHGPAGLVNVKMSDGTHLVAGKKVSAFTDAEEEAVGLTNVVPYLLSSTLASRGALLESAPNFAPKVVVDGRLITGQNPASAAGVAAAVVTLM